MCGGAGSVSNIIRVPRARRKPAVTDKRCLLARPFVPNECTARYSPLALLLRLPPYYHTTERQVLVWTYQSFIFLDLN